MANNWIKMRSDLFTHPKVVRIASALKADTLRTVGGLMSVWCLFDAHSEDGRLDGYSLETLDDQLRWPGFAAAMMAVKWLSTDGESLVLPEFETHNGQSAKRRAQEADRKREVRKTSASDADKKRTREEKRREEEKQVEQGDAFALIPLKDGSDFSVTASLVAEWKTAYRHIDVLSELSKARAWCVVNPDKRKTRAGAAKFLNSWLSRANDDAKAKAPNPNASRPGGGRREL